MALITPRAQTSPETPPKVSALSQLLSSTIQGQRLDRVLRAGRLVIRTFYDGGLEAWGSRHPDDLRKLCQRLASAAPTPPDAIYRAVRLYEVCCRFPDIVNDGILSVSHVVTVLPLESAKQDYYLRAAYEQKWSVRRLRTQIEEQGVTPAATGRPRTPPVVRTLRTLFDDDKSFEGMDTLLTLDPETATRLLNNCHRVQRQIHRAVERLERAVAGRSRARVLFVDGDRAFTRRARHHLEHLTKMIRVEHSCRGALDRPAPDTVCAIIELDLPDGSGIELSENLKHTNPALHCIFLASASQPLGDRPSPAPIVRKSSGLESLKVEVARVLASSAAEDKRALPRCDAVASHTFDGSSKRVSGRSHG